MAESHRPQGTKQIAHDQNTVAHLREALPRSDSMTVSHVQQTLNEQMTVSHLERQMTVGHLAKPVGATPQGNPPAQPTPKPSTPSGTGAPKK
jgi:hypothetical protein